MKLWKAILYEVPNSINSGHLGFGKILRFYWVGMRIDREEWSHAYEVCSAKKGPQESQERVGYSGLKLKRKGWRWTLDSHEGHELSSDGLLHQVARCLRHHQVRYWRMNSSVASVSLKNSISTRGGTLSQSFSLITACSWVSERLKLRHYTCSQTEWWRDITGRSGAGKTVLRWTVFVRSEGAYTDLPHMRPEDIRLQSCSAKA